MILIRNECKAKYLVVTWSIDALKKSIKGHFDFQPTAAFAENQFCAPRIENVDHESS